MRLILIAGPSGAGKSYLAEALARALSSSAIIALDSYYHPLDHIAVEERALQNFDHPDSLDWTLLESHIAALARGEQVRVPIYRFDLHTRLTEVGMVSTPEVLIVEGIHALYRPELRAQAALRIFVTADEDVWLTRRIERDQKQRGRTLESVLRQIESTVKPMAREFLEPLRQHADLIISGDAPIGQSIAAICERLEPAA